MTTLQSMSYSDKPHHFSGAIFETLNVDAPAHAVILMFNVEFLKC
jgi:hypothetical protein